MPLDDKSRFPITVWPGSPLPPVPVQRARLSVQGDGALEWGPDLPPQHLPDEWVLRQLGEADLDDDAVIVSLMQEHGAIKIVFPLRGIVPADRQWLFGVGRVGESKGTLEDARWWLKTARVLARMWAEASVGRYPTSIWAEEGFDVSVWAEEGVDAGGSADWNLFALALTTGLQTFHARVDITFSDGEVAIGEPEIDLYNAACRQVFNLIVEGHAARYCQNQTCGRVFVHQLGGAVFGQHRSRGRLRFCSPECARAETQRQYRRRKAALKKEQAR